MTFARLNHSCGLVDFGGVGSVMMAGGYLDGAATQHITAIEVMDVSDLSRWTTLPIPGGI